MIQEVDPSPAFHKISQADNVYKFDCLMTPVFMTPRRTYLPSIKTLTYSKAEI